MVKRGDIYYFYFLVRDIEGLFCIGVVIFDKFYGLFVVEESFILGMYSIDFVVYEDDDGSFYLYFGGLWGG